MLGRQALCEKKFGAEQPGTVTFRTEGGKHGDSLTFTGIPFNLLSLFFPEMGRETQKLRGRRSERGRPPHLQGPEQSEDAAPLVQTAGREAAKGSQV